MIDSYLRENTQMDDHSIHLLFSANRWEMMKEITEKLNEGITLLVDRYCYSGIVYSAAKGLDWYWCRSPDVGLLCPDIVFYLSLAPEIAASRGDYGNERQVFGLCIIGLDTIQG